MKSIPFTQLKAIIIVTLVALFNLNTNAQDQGKRKTDKIVNDDYLLMNAGANDPVYTTYTAAMDRARLYGDKGYKMFYYLDGQPLNYFSDQAGKIFTIWKIDEVVVNKVGEFYKKPVIKYSFPDMAIMEYMPFKGISVTETFFVYSSKTAIVDIQIKNTDSIAHNIEIYPVFELGNDSLYVEKYEEDGYITTHKESLKRLISNLYAGYGYPENLRNFFTTNFQQYSFGAYEGTMDDFYNTIKTDFYSEDRNDSLNGFTKVYADFISLHGKFPLKAGESANPRFIRSIQMQKENIEEIINEANEAKKLELSDYIIENVNLFKSVPRIEFESKDEKLIYLSAFNLARGCMLPPTGKTNYNFYAFSREPLWGWGHGHQVLHESLSMLTYVYLDPVSAQNSQRVYIEQQGEDGLIAYRHGPRGVQDYPHYSRAYKDTMSTTSAPFFSWINWEIYQVSQDQKFLEDAYVSGVKYVNWLFKYRDEDQDGTFEWGPYGIIENVRDWYNAVFQVSAERYLDVDKEDISDELECLDLTLMVIKEMQCLEKMANALNKKSEAKEWAQKIDKTAKLVNDLMWDEETQFYYSVNKKDHSFKFLTRDLRRKEIIGFLPLWAEIAPKDRADILVKELLNEETFWRPYGVPTLSAADPWYSPYVDYCCKWNGPVWLLWDYMVYDGLKNYGYDKEAKMLAEKMTKAVNVQLSKNHNFWESFSPDNEVLNCPSNYIWDAIIAKLLIETYQNTEK